MGLFENAESGEPTEKCEICVFCGAKFVSNGTLRNHVLNYHKPTEDEKGKVQQELIQKSISCGVCRKHMFDKFSLKRHIRRKHDPKYMFVVISCLLCEEFLFSNQSLFMHMKRKHDSQGISKPTRTENTNDKINVQEDGEISEMDELLKDGIGNESIKVTAESSILVSTSKSLRKEKPSVLPKYESVQNVKDESEDNTVARKVREKIECDQCGFFCDRPSRLKDHKYVVHEGMSFKCELCDASYRSRKILVRHVRKKHEPLLQCDKCDFSGNGNVALKKHNIRDHQVTKEKRKRRNKMHPCNECNFVCDRPYKLKDHMFTRHRGGALICDICETSFSVRHNLWAHKRLHNDPLKHAFKIKKENNECKEVDATTSLYNCDDCGFSCTKPETLAVHKESKHTGLKYECQKCKASFSKSKVLKEHFSEKHGHPESKLLSCDLCGYSTRFEDLLLRHQKTKHMRTDMVNLDLEK